MSPRVVKAISKHIIKPLPTIYIQCFLPDIIPDELKLALVTPVYKANEKELFSNYRPISVRPCFSKILEKLMYKRVLFFLNNHKILTDSQYGFRKNLSTNFQFFSLFQRYLRQYKTVNIQCGFSQTSPRHLTRQITIYCFCIYQISEQQFSRV